MEYVAVYWNQIAFAILGLTFGFAFPPRQFLRFAICMGCYVCAQVLAAYTL